MKDMLLKKIFLFLFLVISVNSFSQNQEDFFKIAYKTQKSFTKIADIIYPTSNLKLINSFSELEKNNQKLFSLLEDYAENNIINDEYLLLLKDVNVVLENLVKDFKNPEELITNLNFIKIDYQAKINSINSNLGVTSDINTKLWITITSKNGEGYSVFGRNSWDTNKLIRYRSNNTTNNAKLELLPGYYILWLEKDGFKSEEKYIELTSTNLANNNIEF